MKLEDRDTATVNYVIEEEKQQKSWIKGISSWYKLKRINSNLRKAGLIAKFFGGDFGLKIKARPEYKWCISYKTDPPTILCPEKDLAEKSWRYNLAVAMHEGGHRDISWSIPISDGTESTRFLYNAVEDPRVNNWLIAKYKGARPYLEELYRETTHIEHDALFDEAKVLPHIQYGYGLIYHWFHGHEHPAINNEHVLDALARTRDDAIEAYNLLSGKITITRVSGEKLKIDSPVYSPLTCDLPRIGQTSVMRQPDISAIKRLDKDTVVLTTTRGHEEILNLPENQSQELLINIMPSAKEKVIAAKRSAKIIKDRILPIYQELVQESREIAKENIDQQNGNGASSQATAGQDIDKQAEQEVERQSREAADRLGRKIPFDEDLEKTASADGEDSNNLQRGRRQDKLGKGHEEDNSKNGTKSEDSDQDASSGDTGEVTTDEVSTVCGEPGSTNNETTMNLPAMKGDLEKDEGKEARKESISIEKSEALTFSEKIALSEVIDRKIDPKFYGEYYAKYYARVSQLIEQLHGILDNELHKDIKPKYKGDYDTGSKINLRKAMSMEYTGKTDIWLRRVNPTKRSYKFSLVIDESGSMGFEKKKINAIHSLVLFQEVLSRLDIDFSIIGFSEDAWTHKEFGKSFKYENKDQLISEILSYINHGRSTNDGGALALAISHLENQDGDARIAIVITDGEGNLGPPIDEYLKLARRKHIGVIGIGVGPGMENVKKYPAYVLVTVVEDLPKAITKLLIDIIVNRNFSAGISFNNVETRRGVT